MKLDAAIEFLGRLASAVMFLISFTMLIVTFIHPEVGSSTIYAFIAMWAVVLVFEGSELIERGLYDIYFNRK